MTKPAAAAPALDLGALKSALDALMASDAFASLKQHLGSLRGAPGAAGGATAGASTGGAMPGGAAGALTAVTGFVKANPLKSAALGLGAAALLSRFRAGKLSTATLMSILGVVGKSVLNAKRA